MMIQTVQLNVVLIAGCLYVNNNNCKEKDCIVTRHRTQIRLLCEHQ